jgi:IS4 transposase
VKGSQYKTEPQRVIDFLAGANWEEVLPGVSNNEIVVLMDSGYDNKQLQNFIQMQGWSFICSIKKSRSVYTETQGKQSIDDFFKNTRKIGQWKTVRTNSGKGRREFRVRILTGVMKGTDFQVSLACSEKNYGDRLYLACSYEKASEGVIARVYKLRWTIEIFHRNIKSYLGFQDVGCEKFESVISHVFWVYCAYLLIPELAWDEELKLSAARRVIKNRMDDEKLGLLLKMNARTDSKKVIAKYYSSVRRNLNVA